MKLLWLKFQSYIVGALAIFLAIVAVFFKGRASGKEAEKQKQEKANVAAVKRKESVKPNNASSVSSKLRKGEF